MAPYSQTAPNLVEAKVRAGTKLKAPRTGNVTVLDWVLWRPREPELETPMGACWARHWVVLTVAMK